MISLSRCPHCGHIDTPTNWNINDHGHYVCARCDQPFDSPVSLEKEEDPYEEYGGGD